MELQTVTIGIKYMNTRFKFRAWNHTAKQMYSVDKLAWDGNDIVHAMYKESYICYDELEDKIMQYTGLRDKNGVEIYEGDFLECINYSGYKGQIKNMPIQEKIDKGWIRPIVWEIINDGECGAICLGFTLDMDSDSYKVIGNIYQNPELITNTT